jgi:Fur family ferric uptake transcriptional regulator
MTAEHPPGTSLAARHRVTRQGAAIDATLIDLADAFHTAQSIHGELRRRSQPVGLATVYRHLRKLAAVEALDVVIQPDGEAAYRLCGTTSGTEATAKPHHHHLVCRICGSTVEVDGPEVEVWARRVARKAGFSNLTHTVEIFGECERHAGRP